jgi:hypothetical protein
MGSQADAPRFSEIQVDDDRIEPVSVERYENDRPIVFWTLADAAAYHGRPITKPSPANVAVPAIRRCGTRARAPRGRPVRLRGSRRGRTSSATRAGPYPTLT